MEVGAIVKTPVARRIVQVTPLDGIAASDLVLAAIPAETHDKLVRAEHAGAARAVLVEWLRQLPSEDHEDALVPRYPRGTMTTAFAALWLACQGDRDLDVAIALAESLRALDEKEFASLQRELSAWGRSRGYRRSLQKDRFTGLVMTRVCITSERWVGHVACESARDTQLGKIVAAWFASRQNPGAQTLMYLDDNDVIQGDAQALMTAIAVTAA